MSYNQKRQQKRIRLFETGLSFVPDQHADQGVQQKPMLAMAIAGGAQEEHWRERTAPVDFFDLKGDVEALLGLTQEAAEFSFKPAQVDGLHPGQSARIYRGEHYIGVIGAIHPSLMKPFGLSERVILCQIALEPFLQAKVPTFAPVSKFQANRRDIAVVVEQSVCAGDVLNVAKKAGGNTLVDLNLFDLYQGSGIEQGFKVLHCR